MHAIESSVACTSFCLLSVHAHLLSGSLLACGHACCLLFMGGCVSGHSLLCTCTHIQTAAQCSAHLLVLTHAALLLSVRVVSSWGILLFGREIVFDCCR